MIFVIVAIPLIISYVMRYSYNTLLLYHSGYWHGRVSLRARGARFFNDLVSFLEEVHILSCIRHHNIQLFMGAAVQPSSRQPLILIMG